MMPLKRFESAVDAAFASQPLPHPNIHVAIWYLLTVSEDSQRLLFTKLGEKLDNWHIEYYLDRYKFALRQCLAAVHQKTCDRGAMALPEKVVPALYERTHNFLAAGIDYSIAVQICSSTHVGSIRLVDVCGGFAVEFEKRDTDERYGALELMRQSAREVVVPFSALLWMWIRHTEHLPIAVHKIAGSTRLSKRRIKYTFQPELSYQLAQSIPQPSFLIPEGWRFPWGGQYETTLLVNALCLRVLYHLCAVHFGAGLIGLKGGADTDICLCICREQLAHDIAMNSSLEPAQIDLFIDYLTYGLGVDTPDQALQPLVPLSNQHLGVAGIGLLSSNVERNLLTLQARLEPRLFDSQSSLFEVEMTRELIVVLEQEWKQIAANRTFQLGNAREELDLLICEPETKTVLVLELRWLLPPADPREVQTKKRVCYQKVDQVARKLAAAKSNLPNLLNAAFDITVESSDEWNVDAAVVIQGFGGALSQCDHIPIVPDWVLEAGVRTAPTLKRLSQWMKSLDWLPVHGRDFIIQENPPELLDIKVSYPGLVPTRPGRDYLEDATATLRIA